MDEVAPESYKQAVLDPEWRKSMVGEIKALRNRGCWRVVPTPRASRSVSTVLQREGGVDLLRLLNGGRIYYGSVLAQGGEK